MIQTSDNLGEFEALPARRPTFLTVLCILTFIGSGWGIISSAVSYFNANTVADALINTKQQMNKNIQEGQSSKDSTGKVFSEKMMNNIRVMMNPEKLRASAVGTIVASFFTLIGAILMWRLSRKGFYLYVLGTIIGIAVPFYVFGNNSLTALSTGFAGFVGILFVIFYAMNLKSMK